MELSTMNTPPNDAQPPSSCIKEEPEPSKSASSEQSVEVVVAGPTTTASSKSASVDANDSMSSALVAAVMRPSSGEEESSKLQEQQQQQEFLRLASNEQQQTSTTSPQPPPSQSYEPPQIPARMLMTPPNSARSLTSTKTTDNNDEIASTYYLSLEDGSIRRDAVMNNSVPPVEDDPSVPSTTHEHILSELFHYFRYRDWKKKLLTVVLAVCFCLVFYDLIFGHYITGWITAFLNWMKEHSVLAVLSFIGIFIVATLIFIPPSLLIFGAGFAFAEACGNLMSGIFSATVACFVGSCIGAVIAFFRARYMMRDLVHLFARRYPIVRAADKALKRNGFRVMVLLRLCPLVPFNGLNYICGITGVKWEEFVLSLLGILPWQILLVAIGATAGTLLTSPSSGNHDHQLVASILIGAGLACGVIALAIIYKFAKKELEKELADANQEDLVQQQQQPQKSQLKLPNQQPDVLHHSDSIEANESGATNYSTMAEHGDQGVEAHYQGEDEEWFWIWA